MQRIFYYTLSVLMLFVSIGFAQAPAQFNYQAVARDANGTPISEKSIAVRIRILDGSSTGSQVHDEIFTNVRTNKYGLFNLAIGSTRAMNITWSSGAKFIEVSIDPNNGVSYTIVGSAQLLSVPYALYSNTAGWANGGGNASTTYVGGTGIQVNGNTIVGLNTSNIWNAGQLQGVNISPNTPQNGNILVFSGSSWSPLNFRLTPGGATAISGDIINGFTITSPSAINYTTGTGIAINGNVISNTSPAANITLQPQGGGISITGSYPTWTISVPSALTPVLSSPTPAVSINGLSFSISDVSNTQSGLMTAVQNNTLQQLSTLVGFDIQNGGGVNISRSGSVYTLSVPTTPGVVYGVLGSSTPSVSFSGPGSVVGGNLSMTIANVNSTQDGLMTSAEFNRLSTITGVRIIGGNGIAVSGGYPNFTITNTTPSSISPWTTSGSNVFYQGGNVGIGTPNPSTNLEVQGNALISGTVTLAGYNGTGVRRLGVDANGQIISGVGVLSLGDITTSTPLLSITGGANAVNGGNVTIDIPNASATSGGLLTQSDYLLFSSKQDGLIPGPGIVINGNTISATGSSFSSQNLSLSGDVLTISGGNSVNLPVASITGVGVTVNNLGGGTIEIINPFTSTGVGYFANTQGVFVNSVTGAIGLAVASVDGYGILGSLDYTKLQSLSSTSLVGSNVSLISSTGSLTTYSIGGSSLGSQNLSLNGDVLTISGGNSVNLPVASIAGIGVTVNNLGGGTIEIINPFTSTGVGYFANTGGVFVNSVTGAIGLAVASVDGYGILSSSDYTKLQTLTGVNLVQGSNININSDLAGNYTITGVATPGTFTTVTGLAPILLDNTNPQSPIVSVSLASGTGPGVITSADFQKLQGLENVSVAGFGVTTTLGPNNILTYQIPSAGTGTVTTVTGLGAISVSNGGTAPVISIASADGINAGTLSPTDYTKLQSLSSTSLVGSNVSLISSTGSLTTYSIGGSSLGSQNLSLNGDVLTISGGNSVNLPVASIAGIGVTVNNLGGGTIEIINPFTSTGVGYFANTGGVFVNSVTGAIGLAVASVDGYGILSSSEYTKLQTMTGVNLVQGPNININSDLAGNYTITGVATPGTFTTVTGLAPILLDNTNPQSPIVSVALASGTGPGVITSADFQKLQGLENVSVAGFGVTTTLGPNNILTYQIPSAGTGTVTTVTGLGAISVSNGGTTPVISIASADGINAGTLSPTDYTKLQSLSSTSLVGSNVSLISSTGSLTTYSIGGSSLGSQNLSLNGDVLTISGGNSVNLPVTSLVGVGVTVNNLGGGNIQIVNPFTSTGIGYFSTSTGLLNVSSTSGAIGLGFAPASIAGLGITTTNGPNGYITYSIPGVNSSFTTLTGIGSLVTVTGGLGSYSIAGIAQTLTLVGNQLALSNGGGTITLPGSSISLTAGSGISITTGVGGLFTISGANIGTLAGTGDAFRASVSLSGNLGLQNFTGFGDITIDFDQVIENIGNKYDGINTFTPSAGLYLIGWSGGFSGLSSGIIYIKKNNIPILRSQPNGVAQVIVSANGTDQFSIAYDPQTLSTEQLFDYATGSISLRNQFYGFSIGSGGTSSISGTNGLPTTTTFSGDVTGLYNALTVGGILNVPIVNTPTTVGQVLQFNGTDLVFDTIAGTNFTTTSIVGSGVALISSGGGIDTYSISGINNFNLTAVGLNGIQATTLGQSISVDGVNFITSIVGLNGLTINKVGQTVSVSASNFNTTSVVGNGVSLVSTIGGINTYSIGGTAFIPTSITGLAGLTVSSSGQSFSISGANLISTSSNSSGDVAGNFLNGFTVTGLRGAPINTSLISPSYLLQFDGSSVVGFNPSGLQTSLTGIGNLVTVTGGVGNYTIAGITPVLSLSGANLSIVGGSQQLPLPLASVVGSNVFTVTGPNGFTTYSISGLSPWISTTGGSIYFPASGTNGVAVGSFVPFRAPFEVSTTIGLAQFTEAYFGGQTSQGVAINRFFPSIGFNWYLNASGTFKNTSGYAGTVGQEPISGAVYFEVSTTVGSNTLQEPFPTSNFVRPLNAYPTGRVGVGIGSSNGLDQPTATLDVYGSMRIRSTTASGLATFLTVDGLGNIGVGSASPATTISVAGLGVTLITSPGLNTYSIAGTSQWISTGSGIVYNTGNVGINTLPTTNGLEVLQTTTASAIVGVIQSAGGLQSAISGIVQSGGTGSTAIYGQSAVSGANIIMANRDLNTTLFKVTTSGQVQIATMSGTGTRFVFADPNGNLAASTAAGILQGTNNGTSNSVAYFDATTNTITGNQAFTFQPTTSTLGVNNIALGTQSVVGNGAVIVYLNASVNLTVGEIVISDPNFNNSVITSSEPGSTAVLGVAYGSCNAGTACPIAISGVVPVRANLVVRGQHCIVSNLPGIAESIPSPNPGSSIGVYISSVVGGFANVLLK